MEDQYRRLMAALEEKAVAEQRDGYTFVKKPIPDSDEAGRLDPRVYEVQRAMAERFAKQAPGDNPFRVDPEDLVGSAQKMRAFMGWDNRDVTGGAVRTELREIEGTEGSIPVRIYTPPGQARRPAVVFFHGGGFIGGTPEVVENPCKSLALHADAVVVSVDYRLAPEHPFPAGLNDCFDAVRWVSGHADELGVDPGRIAVAGDSAGGNLAAVCALRDRDEGTNLIRYQALIYPTVNMGAVATDDFRWSPDEYDIRDHRELILGGLQGMRSEGPNPFLFMYLQGKAEPGNPYVAPLLADLRGLPKTLIVTAEYDYLRIEDEAYARKLARAGVETVLVQYNGTDHAFIDKLGLYPQSEDCMKEIAKGVRAMSR